MQPGTLSGMSFQHVLCVRKVSRLLGVGVLTGALDGELGVGRSKFGASARRVGDGAQLAFQANTEDACRCSPILGLIRQPSIQQCQVFPGSGVGYAVAEMACVGPAC